MTKFFWTAGLGCVTIFGDKYYNFVLITQYFLSRKIWPLGLQAVLVIFFDMMLVLRAKTSTLWKLYCLLGYDIILDFSTVGPDNI